MRPSRVTTASILACAFLALPASASAAPACENAGVRAGNASEAQLAGAAVCLLNKERTRRGLRKLRLNERLSKAARAHTRDMVRRRYFSHTSRAGTDIVDRLSRTGYMRGARSWTVGENLAWGSGERSTPKQVMRAWMNSRGHRANMLNRRFRDVGIGVALAAPNNSRPQSATYTTTFGRRA